MSLPAFVRLRFTTWSDKLRDVGEGLARIQDNVGRAVDPLINIPYLDGVLLKSVALVTGSTNHVPHKLGRALTGWFAVRWRASATVYDAQDANTTPSLTLDLIVSANVTVDLWVF